MAGQIKLTTRQEIIPNVVIKPDPRDIPHTVKSHETLSKISNLYYQSSTLARVIMWRNPELFNEFDIKPGMTIYIPMPLKRCNQYLELLK